MLYLARWRGGLLALAKLLNRDSQDTVPRRNASKEYSARKSTLESSSFPALP
jgi:hypothetical protein